MHVEGSLWKPAGGRMCGSFRPGDLSSPVKSYKYLRSDREDSSQDRQYPFTRVHAKDKKNSPELRHVQGTNEKKIVNTGIVCTESLFV